MLGNSSTEIYGQLKANGQVFLVNPNGMLFGGGARVNASAFVASTLNIRDADFLAGNYTFAGTGGSIDNSSGAAITTSNGPTVRNSVTSASVTSFVATGSPSIPTIGMNSNR